MEKKYRSVGVNAVLNTIKSGMSILFPLITYPYAFRVMHASGMGRVDYSNSIVGYFAMIASLGIGSYAIREGSKLRDDREALSKFASQVFSINFITTIISYILLIVCTLFIPQLRPYALLIMLLSLTTGFNTLGVEWVNPIYEDYLYITIRSIVTHAISLVLLFTLVRQESDYYKYAFIIVSTPAVVCVMNWYRCRKYIDIKLTPNMDIAKHIKPIMYLFANSLATSIYVSADTTMLGIMSGDVAVGLYSIAVKIYGVVKRLLAATYAVAVPRIAYHWGKNDIDSLRNVYSKLLSRLIVLLLPASIGLIAVANEVIYFMGGPEYSESVLTLQILSIALIGAIIGGAVTYCLNIPIGLEKNNLQATTLSAIINIVLNAILMPVFKQNGAAFSTAVSEIFVPVFCVAKNKRFKEFVDFKMLKTNALHAATGCLSIIVIAAITHYFIDNIILSMVIIISLSCITYACELIAFKDDMAISIIENLKKKIPFLRGRK